MLDFTIEDAAVKKAIKVLKDKQDLDCCLQAKVCPMCSDDLSITIRSDKSNEYHCLSKDCTFMWPQKGRDRTAYLICLNDFPEYVVLNDRDKAVEKMAALLNTHSIRHTQKYKTRVEYDENFHWSIYKIEAE